MKQILAIMIVLAAAGVRCFSNTGRGGADIDPRMFTLGVGSAVQIAQQQSIASWNDGAQRNAAIKKAQKEEIDRINSTDPFRAMNGTTNFAGGEGWWELQGTLVEKTRDGWVFEGACGRILGVQFQYGVAADINGVFYPVPNCAGPDGRTHQFIVKNLPWDRVQRLVHEVAPPDAQSNRRPPARPVFITNYFIMEKMAYFVGPHVSDSGTIPVFDYGTPSVKRYSMPEMLAIKASYDAPYVRALTADFDMTTNANRTNQISARLRLYERYLEADTVPKNLDKALYYVTDALIVDHDEPVDFVNETNALANLQQLMADVAGDRKSAEAGNADGLFNLGKRYLNGRIDDGVDKDLYLALDLFNQGAAAGSAAATDAANQLHQHLLASLERDEQLKAQGDPDGLYRMGERYFHGRPEIGIDANLTAARHDFIEAIAAGSPNAAYVLDLWNHGVMAY